VRVSSALLPRSILDRMRFTYVSTVCLLMPSLWRPVRVSARPPPA
jgi:hypothetical protein